MQGVWTSDDSYGVPFERPLRFTEIVQTPGLVAIRYEMIHEAL